MRFRTYNYVKKLKKMVKADLISKVEFDVKMRNAFNHTLRLVRYNNCLIEFLDSRFGSWWNEKKGV